MTEPLSQVLILLASAVFLVTLVRRLGLSTMMGYLRWVPGMDIRDDVARISCPTLIINTTGSSMRAADSYKEWQPRIRDSKLVTIEGDAWHAAGAYPDACAEETLNFIERNAAHIKGLG